MSTLIHRAHTLYGLSAARKRVHRYTWWRWGIAVVSTLGIAALPLTDTLRIDLWSGRNMWLGEQVDTVQAIRAFAFPFLAVNVAIILASRFVGRWLCGFGCPVGNLARLSEWTRWYSRKGKSRFSGYLFLLATVVLLAAITFSFWVDWRVFRDGSPLAIALSAGFLLGLVVGLMGIVRGLELRFCRDYCPSGIYFAVLGPSSATGIKFANPDSCTECKACDVVCPVDLHPREMAEGEARDVRGLYPAGLTNFANCLRCGDCIAACEGTTARNNTPTPLELGFVERQLEESLE